MMIFCSLPSANSASRERFPRIGQRRKRNFEQFVHVTYIKYKVFEFHTENFQRVFGDCFVPRTAFCDQIQLCFDGGTHFRLNQVRAELDNMYYSYQMSRIRNPEQLSFHLFSFFPLRKSALTSSELCSEKTIKFGSERMDASVPMPCCSIKEINSDSVK
uniref:Uncharacterized protein n=1 Tax=Romanomermis culicivorax TaxID=13658 RepID=A0A915HL34_ROMCU